MAGQLSLFPTGLSSRFKYIQRMGVWEKEKGVVDFVLTQLRSRMNGLSTVLKRAFTQDIIRLALMV